MSISHTSSTNKTNKNMLLLDDNFGEFDILDTKLYKAPQKTKGIVVPEKITGTYSENYDILRVDEIIRHKLEDEKYTHLNNLKMRCKELELAILKPQTIVTRKKTLDDLIALRNEITEIETGEKLKNYQASVKAILDEYKTFDNKVKTVAFGIDEKEEYVELGDERRRCIYLIDSFFDIAKKYITVDVIRVNNIPSNLCLGCNASLEKVAQNDDGFICCPECQTEHNTMIVTKSSKDGSRINSNGSTEDESIDNFLRAFTRYHGLQQDKPNESLYQELDDYFIRLCRPTGEEIRKLPLNERGTRGDTDHKMLWSALSQIGRSEYYEDANWIGHVYWGWTLPDAMKYKEIIISDYNETQKVFYQIPAEERERDSSLGTQYRLWRHLQLVGHTCYMDQFKIAENPESLRKHHKTWRAMCIGTNNPRIQYIS